MTAAHPRAGEASQRSPGVTLLRTLRGHESYVGRIAWSPDGRLLATPSADKTIRLWDADTGECVRTLDGYGGIVYAVTFDPAGRILASVNQDRTVKLWDPQGGQLLRSLKGHTKAVFSVAFDPTGTTLVSGGQDKSIRFWNVADGKMLRAVENQPKTLLGLTYNPRGGRLTSGGIEGQATLAASASGKVVRALRPCAGGVHAVAFDPDGRTLACACDDGTVKLWNSVTGRLRATLEGHTDGVRCVAFSPDGRVLASKGGARDNTVRLWHAKSGALLATMAVPASDMWPPGLAFHPTRPLLAAVGSDPDTPEDARDGLTTMRDRVVHVWEIGFDDLLAQSEGPAVTTLAAKVALVGDPGPAKTALGWRVSHGAARDGSSAIGQQFWMLDQLTGTRPDGVQCEAVLWEFAGQPEHRVVGAFGLEAADLAIVLCNPGEGRDPLRAADFWLTQIKNARAAAAAEAGTKDPDEWPIILVAAPRAADGAAFGADELEAFGRQRGLRDCLYLDPAAEENAEPLVERLRMLLPWDEKPATVTTVTFKWIKDFVLALKQDLGDKEVVVSPSRLRRRLEATDRDWKFSDAEMMAAVAHLESEGVVAWLRTSKGDRQLLLAPELLNSLATSVMLEARRDPKGLGAIAEAELLSGACRFPEGLALSTAERDTLLDAAVLSLLRQNACYRELDALSAQAHLIFPGLASRTGGTAGFESPLVDGPAYTVGGDVDHLYASLVILMGSAGEFVRVHCGRNLARYEGPDRAVCGFRLDAEREGERDFVLSFGASVGSATRLLFQGLFESLLARRGLRVFRYMPIACPACAAPLDRSIVRERMRDAKATAFCPGCGGELKLPRTDAPMEIARELRDEVESLRCTAELRARFEEALYRIVHAARDLELRAPECFISYAWGKPEHERWVEQQLAIDLQKAGIGVTLDRWEQQRFGRAASRFIDHLDRCDRVLVVGTPLYREKFEHRNPKRGYAVGVEVDMVARRLEGTAAQKESVLPLLLDADRVSSFPLALRGEAYADFRNQHGYFAAALDLILGLYGLPPDHHVVADLRMLLRVAEAMRA